MELIYGTGNPAKLEAMRNRLNGLDIEIIGLYDLDCNVPKIVETGSSPLENARQKATSYYEVFKRPVFSCDSGLYFDNVPKEDQPGVHVRNIGGRCLTDEEMIEHYSGLAKRYGNLTARYKNAICLVIDKEHIYEAMEADMESERFIIDSIPHHIVKKGFPLDSLSRDIESKEYYYDMVSERLDEVAVEIGFLRFFEKVYRK